MVAVEVNNSLHLKYILKVDSIGLGHRINRKMMKDFGLFREKLLIFNKFKDLFFPLK